MTNWYGWIPTIAGPETLESRFREFIWKVKFRADRDWKIVENTNNLYIIKKIDSKQRIEIHTSRDITADDNIINSIKLIKLYYDRNLVAKVDKIELDQRTGIIKYDISSELSDGIREKSYAMIVYNIICEMFSPYKRTSIPIEPVNAHNFEDAIQKIQRQFSIRIYCFRQELETYVNTKYYREYFSLFRLLHIIDEFKIAIEEITYAISFCNICNLTKIANQYELSLTYIENLMKIFNYKIRNIIYIVISATSTLLTLAIFLNSYRYVKSTSMLLPMLFTLMLIIIIINF